VWGAKDPTSSLRVGQATHEAIAGSQLAVLQTGHVVFSSDPADFLAVVGPFLRRIDADGQVEANSTRR